jgi:dihydroorotase
MSKLLIINGRVLDPANNVDEKADIYIEDGKIVEIAADLKSKTADETVDAAGKVVAPGFIDIHVHLREPGREDKETIKTASRSAAKGGITSVVAMPNTNPPADSQAVIEYVLSRAKTDSVINIFMSGCITQHRAGHKMAEIWEMKRSGAIAITDDGSDVQDMDLYRKAMQYCKTHDMPMISHSEDVDLACGGHMHEGKVSSRLGIRGVPACTEDVATSRIICLLDDVKHQMHFTHVSTKGSIDLIKFAKQKGLNVTADVTPHHFSLTDEAVGEHDTYAKVAPPLRSEDHRQALLNALKDGTVEVIATDHAPHLWTEKEGPFQEAPVGIVGFETMLSLIITNLVEPGVLTLSDALAKITVNPAQVLKLEKGTLSIGADADIAIFDPEAEWTVDRTALETKGQNTPFHGYTLKGVVTETVVGGKLVLVDSKIKE